MGLTVIDSGVLIGFLDAADVHHEAARRALAAARERSDTVALPASHHAASLVAPSRSGDDAVATLRSFIERFPIQIIPLDQSIAEAAAQIHARLGKQLRLPDALVVATAQALDASTLITTNSHWPRRTKLRLQARLEQI